MKMWSGKKYSIVMAVLIICVMSVPAAAQLADAPWPMFHHDLNHTGLSTGYGPDTSAVNWTFSTGSRIYGSAAIGEDGTIYIGTRNPGSKLYAIYPNGTENWHWNASNFIDSTPAVASDGTIYVGSWDKNLYAFYPNGTKKWEFGKCGSCTHCGGFVLTSAAIASDGIIYIGNNNNKLYAIHPNGTEKWNYSTANSVQSSPAIGSDGTIYVGSCDKKLYAIHPNGTEKWNYSTGGEVESSPAIDADGTIYVGSKDGHVYAINPNGTLLWNYYTGKKVYYSSPAIAADGMVYIGNWDGNLYAFGPGTQPPGTSNMPPVLDAIGDKTINEAETVTIDLDATDQDGDPLTYSCNQTGMFNDFDQVTGKGNWTTDHGDAGTYYVDFGVSDGNGGTDNETIRIDVLDANRPPVLDAIGNKTINETETVMIDLNATDQDGDTLTYSCLRTDLFADFDPLTGTENWTTGYTDSGTYWVNFGVSDGNGGIDNETIRITVSDANRAPVLGPVGDETINETETVAIDLNATDQDGDSLTYSCNRTDLFTDFDPVTGKGNWTTDYNDAGTYWVNFGVSDGNGGTDNETIQITVLDSNRQPFFDVVGGGECRKIGEQFDVLINITPMGIPFMGAQFDLHFDAGALKAETVAYGDFLTQDGWSNIDVWHTDINNANGVVEFAAARQGTSDGVTSPGTFAIVHFTAETQGMTSELNLTNALASDNATPVNTYELVTHNDTVEVCLNTPPAAVAKSNFTYNNIAEKGLSKAYFIGTDSNDGLNGTPTNYRWWVDDGSSLVGEIAEHLFVVPMYWQGGSTGYYALANVTLTVTRWRLSSGSLVMRPVTAG
jgi:outer membrane protein assembly factor BamB